MQVKPVIFTSFQLVKNICFPLYFTKDENVLNVLLTQLGEGSLPQVCGSVPQRQLHTGRENKTTNRSKNLRLPDLHLQDARTR